MPVIANPADPSYCNFGRDGVELCTPEWYREGPEATWLAEATLASQLENKGTRQGKEARARYRSSQSADPCGNLRFPLRRPPWDLDPSRGDGAAGCRARRHLQPARCGCRGACCSCGPTPRIRAVGGWEGTKGAASPVFSPTKAPARVSGRVDFFFRRSGVRCAVGASCPKHRVLCGHRCESGNEAVSGMHSSCSVSHPSYDKRGIPQHDQQDLPGPVLSWW